MRPGIPTRNALGWLVAACCMLHAGLAPADTPPPLLLAHYMPWFEADPSRGAWGWHWTMNRYDPNVVVDGRREIASKFQPAIGPYDSADPHVVEYHLLLMKLAGLDGVIVDWYGRADLWDYSRNHRCTQLVVDRAAELGMRVAICYEDKTLADLVKEGRITPDNRVPHAVSEIDWLAEQWFSRDHYVRLDGRPVLLSFGHEGLGDEEWSQVLARLRHRVAYFSEHRRRPTAVGGFDWPVPKEGLVTTERFAAESRDWPGRIPVAFPRFVDIYAEAGVHPSWGRIDDDGGRTFSRTLDRALAQKPPIVQIATWNDWGEGTMIEPSIEFGTRDLEVIQRRRRDLTPELKAEPRHLSLPGRLLSLRRSSPPAGQARLDGVADRLARLDIAAAEAELQRVEDSNRR